MPAHFRFFASVCLLFAALALPLSRALAESPSRSTLDMDKRMRSLTAASQHSAFYRDYTYKTFCMYDSGCGPVSLANAMGAAFGLSDVRDVQTLSIELVHALTPKKAREQSHITVSALPGFLGEQLSAPQPEAYPTLCAMLGGHAADLDIAEGKYSGEDEALMLADTDGGLYVRSMPAASMWANLLRLCRALEQTGRGDAIICVGYLGVGRASSGSPLHTSGSGHYVSIAVGASSFAQDGTVYLLDSLPRSLKGEPIDGTTPYTKYMPFVTRYRFTAFREAFDAVRIKPTVIRFTPSAENLAALRAMDGDPDAREAYMLKLYDLFILFGQGTAFFDLPPAS